MTEDIRVEYELLQQVLALQLKLVDTKIDGFEDNVHVRITLEDDPEILESCALGLIFALGVLSFHDARPRGVSGMHFREQDQFYAGDMVRGLRIKNGVIHFYADYVRGRMMKTTVEVYPDGKILLETMNRGESASRWVKLLRGKKHLSLVEAPAEPGAARTARPRKAKPSSKATAVADAVYQLKVTLEHIRPSIWRRVVVPGNARLDTLHYIIQIVMGWNDAHLHEFRIGKAVYGPNLPDDEGHALDEKKVRLAEVVRREKGRFGYVYDFGDDWHHEIVVEKIGPPEPDTHYPVCIEGKRNGAPEDCGGVSGYAGLMCILKNPKHEEYEERREWVGEDYDPDCFALDAINEALRGVRVK